jgi:hypothetical protein
MGVYGLRPLAGQTASYPSQLYAGVWTQGASYWVMRVLNPLMWQRFAILGLGIGPLCAVLWQRGGLWKTTMMRGALWGLGPCVLIRFFGMAWGYHYEACLGAGLLGWMMAGWGEAFRPTKREASAIIFGLAAAWAWAGTCADAGAATAPWGHYGHERVQCPAVPQRTRMLAHLQQTLLRDTASCVLVGQNLAPLLASHPNLYVLGGPQPPETLHYEYVWVEVPPMGDTWPLDAETIRAAISMWRASPGVRIIVDDAFMFAAHGWLPYPDNATFR